MADFCHRALAYMTGRPLEEFAKKKTAVLSKELLAQLHARPWLFILDGLERVLVAIIHRIDAAGSPRRGSQRPDRQDRASRPVRCHSRGGQRPTPCARRRQPLEDPRQLPAHPARAAQSRRPDHSRRAPHRFARPAPCGCGKAAPAGSCGRENDSDFGIARAIPPAIRGLLSRRTATTIHSSSASSAALSTTTCPIAGTSTPGWPTRTAGPRSTSPASTSSSARKPHPPRPLARRPPRPPAASSLSTLAFYSRVCGLRDAQSPSNPHIPPEPTFVRNRTEVDWKPRKSRSGTKVSGTGMPTAPYLHQGRTERPKRRRIEQGIRRRPRAAGRTTNEAVAKLEKLASAEYRVAPRKLAETVGDLERRGLLQWDGRDRRYNLHPVIRGVAAGGMKAEEKQRYGQRVVDHFSSLPHNPYEQAETLDDLRDGLHVVRTLLKLGHFQQAADAYRGDLSNALFFNIEAYAEALSLLRPFLRDWLGRHLPQGRWHAVGCRPYLANDAAISLASVAVSLKEAVTAFVASLRSDLETETWSGARVRRSATHFRHLSSSTRTDWPRRLDRWTRFVPRSRRPA